MTDSSTPNTMKARAEAALKAKKLAEQASAHGDAKASGKSAAKSAKQPKARIIRHQGR
jgi:hypothetical protein